MEKLTVFKQAAALLDEAGLSATVVGAGGDLGILTTATGTQVGWAITTAVFIRDELERAEPWPEVEPWVKVRDQFKLPRG